MNVVIADNENLSKNVYIIPTKPIKELCLPCNHVGKMGVAEIHSRRPADRNGLRHHCIGFTSVSLCREV